MDELKLIGAAFAEPEPTPEAAAAKGRDRLLRLTCEARTARLAGARRSWPPRCRSGAVAVTLTGGIVVTQVSPGAPTRVPLHT
ncbi:hypothetical protein [Nonomuraea bangladeshensis]|uniref:hypothetical protein n=1 Tax=Nonomuraea bangladeshensis TaxID=404385 RepID=UPI003C2F0B97